MNEHRLDEMFDDLLDAHLRQPDLAEPSLGFASRLLARVNAGQTRRHAWALWFASATALAALVIAGILVFRSFSGSGQRTFPQQAKSDATVAPISVKEIPDAASYSATPATTRMTARRAPRSASTPPPADERPDVFPSPSPLSEQERLALGYLRGTPRAEVVALSRPDVEPLQELNQYFPNPNSNNPAPINTR